MSIQGTQLYTKSKETIYPITNSNSVQHGDKSLNEVIDSVEEEVSSFKSEVKSEVDKINNFESQINSIQDQIKNLQNNIPSDTPSDTPDENIPVNFTNQYTLIPSSHVINKGDTITVKIRKTTQEGSTLLNYGNAWSSEDLKVQYSINGTNWFDYRPKIIVDSNITLRLKQNTTIIDEETIQVLDVPEAFFQSFVFCRCSEKPDKPIGGSYTDPKPNSEIVTVGGKNTNCKWEDSVPNGTDTVWMSSCRFSSVNPNTADWSNPADMSDSVKMEIIYSPGVEDNDGNITCKEIPIDFNRTGLEINGDWLASANAVHWYDEPENIPDGKTPVWMAINTYENNAWQGWQISRIKGEDGKNGTSITIKGSVASKEELNDKKDVSISDSYITLNDGHLHVWDGDSWTDCGPFKGEPGESGKANFLHIKYANLAKANDNNSFTTTSGLKLVLTDNDGEDVGDFMGTLVDENPKDPTDLKNLTENYKWKDLSPLTIRFDPPRLYIKVDSDNNILSGDDNGIIQTINIYAYSGTNQIKLTENSKDYSITISQDNNSSIDFDDWWYDNGVLCNNIISTYGTNYIICTITENATKRTATETFNIIYVKDGKDGKQGAAGPMLYPQGEWNSTTTYTLTKKDGNVIAKPFVVYKNEDGKDEYYVLKQDSTNNKPSEKNSEHWEKFTKIKYLFTEALMADWAKLAQFVFYDNMLFSQQGHDISGNQQSFEKNPSIFSGDKGRRRFSGSFIPNSFFDAYSGAIGCCKLSEQYKVVNSQFYKMDLLDSHNISIDTSDDYDPQSTNHYIYQKGYEIGGSSMNEWKYNESITFPIVGQPRIIVLPEDTEDGSYEVDGTHITIVNQRNDDFNLYSGTSSNFAGVGSPVLVTSNSNIFNIDNTGKVNKSNSTPHIIWKGYLVFGVLIPHGCVLKLRSVVRKNSDGDLIRDWYVENASDFEQIGFHLTVAHSNKQYIDNDAYINSSSKYTRNFVTKIDYTLGDMYTYQGIVIGGQIVKGFDLEKYSKDFSIFNRNCGEFEAIKGYTNGNKLDNTGAAFHMVAFVNSDGVQDVRAANSIAYIESYNKCFGKKD